MSRQRQSDRETAPEHRYPIVTTTRQIVLFTD
jgi:hypothetical protein